MRRLWATAASGAVLLLSAGCSTEPGTSGSAAPAAPTTGAAVSGPAPSARASGVPQTTGDAALAGNTGAVCSQAARLSGQAAAAYAENLKILVDASSAKNKDLTAKAKEETERDIESWSFALADLSKLVADPGVKKALGDMSKQVVKLKADVQKIDDAELAKVRATLDTACGKA
jgi:hypothetical protein